MSNGPMTIPARPQQQLHPTSNQQQHAGQQTVGFNSASSSSSSHNANANNQHSPPTAHSFMMVNSSTSPPPPPPLPEFLDGKAAAPPSPPYVSTFGLLSTRLARGLDGNTRFVKLNVGGKEFITTTETLCKEYSMLSVMVQHHQKKLGIDLNDNGTEKTPEEKKSSKSSSSSTSTNNVSTDISKQEPLFIDRDSTHFLEILNYLRNGMLDPLPSTEEHWKALLREADFYGIQSLIDILKANYAKPKYKFYVLIKGNSFYNCQVYPPPKSYEKRHSNPCNMVSCLNAHLRDGFEIDDIVWPTISSDACQAILYKWMAD